MDTITLDFETFYRKRDYSLSKIPTQVYIEDSRFEVIGIAVKVNDGPTEWFSGSKEQTKQWLGRYDWDKSAVCAHNAMFDMSILNIVFGIRPKRIYDTLSMARAIHGMEVGGSLKALAIKYDIGEKGTEIDNADGKQRKDFTPEQLAQYGEYCKNDVELTYQLLCRFSRKFDPVELHLIDMTVRMHSEPKFELDVYALEANLHTVKTEKERLLAEVAVWLAEEKGVLVKEIDNEILKQDLRSNPRFAKLLESYGVEVPMKPKKPTKVNPNPTGETYAFATTDEGFKELEGHEDLRIQTLYAARVGIKSTLEERRTERFIGMARSVGYLAVPLLYYGALTGRWAASDKINLQNIPRKSKLKEAIMAPEGSVIVGADLSNIELRVGLYFAGEKEKLQLLADGMDLYKDFASSAFDVAYDEVDDEQRFIGKTSQLSLIYGVGAVKLRAAIKSGSGKDIGWEEAQRIVTLYREEYFKVAAAWDKSNDVIDWLWSLSHETFAAKGTQKSKSFGTDPLLLDVHNLYGIRLPSGMYLPYPDLQKVEKTNEMSYATRNGRARIYGAKCFQNTVQALARCVMGEAMVRIHKRYPIALTIHDACYCVVPEGEAEEARRFIIHELRKEPAWAPGIPLDAEGGYGENLSFKMTKL